jgi:signal transduction histidine kinase/ActR/RegA family two-component response regulator
MSQPASAMGVMPSWVAAGRVVVLAPLGRDASVVCEVLSAAGITCEVTSTLADLGARIAQGAGAALLTQEALTSDGLAVLSEIILQQPSWSDLPLVLLLAETDRLFAEAAPMVAALRRFGNVTVLVRPVPTVALVSATQSALRARMRQYEVRDLIEREHAARLEAERANTIKDQFLATVSHELRTPLSAILLWSGLMSTSRLDPARTRDGLQAIQHSAELQSRLIEDLLDVSRTLCGKLQLQTQEIELATATQAAVAVVQPMAQAKHIKLETFIDPAAGIVRADPDRVQQVVWNLLGNAIKFTPAGGSVSINLQREDAQVAIRVIDTGQGIAADFVPHVFDRFRQADAAPARRHGGLGLGLAITHQLVELHGGSIVVQSEGVGRGATFTVRLPLARPEDSARQHSPRSHEHQISSRPLKGLRVLLVEDEPATRDALTLVLEEAGAEVIAVHSAAAALRELQGCSVKEMLLPDVVLSDIGLPGEDGFTLIRNLREHERAVGKAESLRAVAISAYTGPAMEDRARSSGFQSYIAKPVDADELIQLLLRP